MPPLSKYLILFCSQRNTLNGGGKEHGREPDVAQARSIARLENVSTSESPKPLASLPWNFPWNTKKEKRKKNHKKFNVRGIKYSVLRYSLFSFP